MAYFMEDGNYNAHLRRMKSAYRLRRDTLVYALEKHASQLLRPEPCRAGMHLIARFVDSSVSDQAMSQRLWNAGIDCLPLSLFVDQANVDPGLLLGFACAPETEIETNVLSIVQFLR